MLHSNDDASDKGDPFVVAGNTSKSGGKASCAAGTGAETNNAHLIVYSVVIEAQWAARVTL